MDLIKNVQIQKIKVFLIFKIACYKTFPNECEACLVSKFYKKNKCDFIKRIKEKKYPRIYCEDSDRK